MINSKILVSLLATASLLLTGCAAKTTFTEESLEHQSPVTYIYNKNDKIDISFYTQNTCEERSEKLGGGTFCSLYRYIATTCDFSSSSECQIVGEAGKSGHDAITGILDVQKTDRNIKTYWIDKNRQEKGNDTTLTFIPKKYRNEKHEDGFLPSDRESAKQDKQNKVINVTDYISNPERLSLSTKKEFISKYNQESILGNFVRHGLIETDSLKAVTNKIPLKISLGYADVSVPLQTYAYKNGTMVSVDYLSIRLNGRKSTINLNTIKQETLRIIENAVNN